MMDHIINLSFLNFFSKTQIEGMSDFFYGAWGALSWKEDMIHHIVN